jgi:hypothetical protein
VKSEKPERLTKQMLTFSFHLAGNAGEESEESEESEEPCLHKIL